MPRGRSAPTNGRCRRRALKAAIFGCGHAGELHARALARLDGLRLVAACDLDEGRRTRLARRFEIPKTYASAEDLLERERPDVVHVATPPQSHCALTVTALEQGCHVLVEKPMALDSGEAGEMVTAALRQGRTLGVCHNFLYHPVIQRLRELVARGRLGQVVGADIFWRPVTSRGADRYEELEWAYRLPGGVFHESAPHVVYLQQAFLGPVVPIAAVSRDDARGAPPAGELRAIFEGENGLGSTTISHVGAPGETLVRVNGTEMSATADVVQGGVSVHRWDWARNPLWRAFSGLDRGGQLVAGTTRTGTAVVLGRWDNGHRTLVRDFYGSLQGGVDPPVTAEDGKGTVEVLDRLWALL